MDGEKVEMSSILSSFFKQVESIEKPGTLDAGDVMMTGLHFYIGISERTNHEGADQLLSFLEKYGRSGEKVGMSKMLHLKSGVSYLEQNNMLVSGEFIAHPAFNSFGTIEVEADESYAANSLWINEQVLVAKGFPKTRKKIEQKGYKCMVIDVSEFKKLDGGLSCLSLRF